MAVRFFGALVCVCVCVRTRGGEGGLEEGEFPGPLGWLFGLLPSL